MKDKIAVELLEYEKKLIITKLIQNAEQNYYPCLNKEELLEIYKNIKNRYSTKCKMIKMIANIISGVIGALCGIIATHSIINAIGLFVTLIIMLNAVAIFIKDYYYLETKLFLKGETSVFRKDKKIFVEVKNHKSFFIDEVNGNE